MKNEKIVLKEEQLKGLKLKEILALPEAKLVKGRHNMRKDALMAEIISNLTKELEEELNTSSHSAAECKDENMLTKEMLEKAFIPDDEDENDLLEKALYEIDKNRKKENYVTSASIGTLIAFKVDENKTLSGKIEEINKNGFVVCTRNGIKFTVLKKNVIWVKTGDRWPKGVYLQLKRGLKDEYRKID